MDNLVHQPRPWGKLAESVRNRTDELELPSMPDQGVRHVPRMRYGQISVPLQADPVATAAFADLVGQALDGCVLRYSNRLSLLDRAAKMGIGRFEANLIIATVQYRREHVPANPPRRSYLPILIAFAIGLQALIVAAVWRLLGA